MENEQSGSSTAAEVGACSRTEEGAREPSRNLDALAIRMLAASKITEDEPSLIAFARKVIAEFGR
jgi:hypothetical protein